MTRTPERTETPAGRELDALVAERVMGYQWRRVQRKRDANLKALFAPERSTRGTDLTGNEAPSADYAEGVPSYSTDIAAAWLVLLRIHSKIGDEGWVFSRRRRFHEALASLCVVDARPAFPPKAMSHEAYQSLADSRVAWPDAMGVFAERMPEFICRAALSVASELAPSVTTEGER